MINIILRELLDQPLINNHSIGYVDSTRQIGPVNIGLIFVGVMLIIFLIYAPDGIIPEVKKNNAKYYAMAKYYETKSSEGDKLLDILKSVTGYEDDAEDWIA